MNITPALPLLSIKAADGSPDKSGRGRNYAATIARLGTRNALFTFEKILAVEFSMHGICEVMHALGLIVRKRSSHRNQSAPSCGPAKWRSVGLWLRSSLNVHFRYVSVRSSPRRQHLIHFSEPHCLKIFSYKKFHSFILSCSARCTSRFLIASRFSCFFFPRAKAKPSFTRFRRV